MTVTLLHQAAQKAVEAHYKELGDAWIAFDGSPGTAKRVNFALGMLGFAIDALVAQMSALQQQEVPREPVAWVHKDALIYHLKEPGGWAHAHSERVPGTYDLPLYASPSTTQQQEVGSIPPAKLVNGQWTGVPISRFPELQEQVRKGLADGTLSIGGAAPVTWTQEDEKRLDEALAMRADARGVEGRTK